MKNIIQIAILACILGVSINAIAADHTVSLGYAQTNVKDFKNLKGVNAQYRYENQSPWGAVVSSTYTSGSESFSDYLDSGQLGEYEKIKVNYFSVLAGPSYRFNEYVSAYALAGFANVKVKNDYNDYYNDIYEKDSKSKTGFAYGVGVSVNPVENIAINVGYEGSSAKFYDDRVKFNGFNIGVGYKF